MYIQFETTNYLFDLPFLTETEVKMNGTEVGERFSYRTVKSRDQGM